MVKMSNGKDIVSICLFFSNAGDKSDAKHQQQSESDSGLGRTNQTMANGSVHYFDFPI